MVSLGVHTAFFFIFFLRTAISYSVSLNQGAHLLPGLASGGGGDRRASALLVDIPAMELCTFVPEPGMRARDLGCFRVLSLGCFSLLGVPTRSVVDLTSESEPSDELKLRALAPGTGTAVLLRSRGRAAEAVPWRPPSKVRRRCGGRSKARLSEREA
jgi:hypothetical protein